MQDAVMVTDAPPSSEQVGYPVDQRESLKSSTHLLISLAPKPSFFVLRVRLLTLTLV